LIGAAICFRSRPIHLLRQKCTAFVATAETHLTIASASQNAWLQSLLVGKPNPSDLWACEGQNRCKHDGVGFIHRKTEGRFCDSIRRSASLKTIKICQSDRKYPFCVIKGWLPSALSRASNSVYLSAIAFILGGWSDCPSRHTLLKTGICR
jgi:hypothetical protein